MKVKMKGEVDILANFPIDTSLKKKTHSALSGIEFNHHTAQIMKSSPVVWHGVQQVECEVLWWKRWQVSLRETT